MASTAGAIRAGRAFVELFADTKKLEKGLKGAQVKLRRFAAATQQVGRQMMAAAAIGAAPLAMATRTFAAFEDQMAAVRAVTGAVESDFRSLTEQAKELGRTTSFTASQVAEGMTSLGRAGFSAQEIRNAIPAVLDLARATGTELGQAADIAAQTIRAFGLEASDTTRVADVLVATANNSAQTLDDLGESFAYVAPIAAEAGESVESTAKMLGVLANMGIKGSMAGTTLRQSMLQLSDPGIQQRLRDLGVTAEFVAGNMGEVMAQVGQAMAEMPKDQRLALAKDLFGQRAVTGAMKLMGGPEQMQALVDAIDNNDDAARRTAATMDNTLGGAFRRLFSAVEGVQIAIGETLNAAIDRHAKQITEIAGQVTAWIQRNRELVVALMYGVGVLGAVGAAVWTLGLAFKTVSVAIGIATTATHAFVAAATFAAAHPIVALAIGLAAVATAYWAVSKASAAAAKNARLPMDQYAQTRTDDVGRFEELEKLANKQKLSNTEMERAQELLMTLSSRYGDLGISIDTAAGKIDGMTEAQGRLNEAMRRIELNELEMELRDIKHQFEQTSAEMQSHYGWGWNGWFGTAAGLQDLGHELDQLESKRLAIEARMELLRGPDAPGALGGATAPEALAPRGPMAVMSEYLRLGMDAGGTFIQGWADALDKNRDLLDNLAKVRISAIDDDLERDLATIEQRYNQMRRQAREQGQNTGLLDTAEAEERQQAIARDAERKAAEAARIAENEAGVRAENERLAIEAAFEGPARDRMLLNLERRLAVAEARENGIDPDLIRRQYDLREELLEQRLATGQSGPTASGTFSAAAAMAMGRGVGADPMLQKADRQIDLLANIERAVHGGIVVLD